MTEDNSREMRFQKPLSQILLLTMAWANEGLNANDIAMLLAVTVRSLEDNRGMTGLAQQLGTLLPKN